MDVPGWSAGPTVIQRIPPYATSLRTSQASVAQTRRRMLAPDDDQASAGARSAPAALLHLWGKAVAPPSLSSSMQSGGHRSCATRAAGSSMVTMPLLPLRTSKSRCGRR